MVNNINQWTYEEDIPDDKITDMDITAGALKSVHPEILEILRVKSGVYNPEFEKLILFIIDNLQDSDCDIYNPDTHMIDALKIINFISDYDTEYMLDLIV